MIRNNPYSQGGWSSFNTSGDSSSTSLVAFTFVFANIPKTTPSILNSTILAPHSRPHLRVVSDPLLPDYTIIKDTNNVTVAVIGWAEHPFVELHGSSVRKRVRDWLPLSGEQNTRSMQLRNVQYTWVPCGSTVCLYNTRYSPPTLMARITRAQGQIVLELTMCSATVALTECIVATVLLMCGRRID